MQVFKDMAGWRTIGVGKTTAIHIFLKKEFWYWGYSRDWYDGPLHQFGLGPLLLITWGPK